MRIFRGLHKEGASKITYFILGASLWPRHYPNSLYCDSEVPIRVYYLGTWIMRVSPLVSEVSRAHSVYGRADLAVFQTN